MSVRILILLVTLTSFTGCGFIPSFSFLPEASKDSTDVSIPDAWSTRLTNASDAHQWVSRFNDPTLSGLVQEAIQNNNSLQATALRIDQLKSAELITKGRQKPDLSVSTGVTNSGSLDDWDASESTPYSLSLGSSWELDLWGRLKDQREQASLDTASAQADYFAARLSLSGSVTSAYFNLLSAQNSLTLAEETLSNYEKSLRIIERNYKAGVPGVDALDVQFGRNNVTSSHRNISEAKLNLTRSSQALQILLGRHPEGSLRENKELPSPLSSLPSVLPMGVIEQRPDLISARSDLASLIKEIDIRQKALLPSVSLRGGVSGDRSVALDKLLNPAYLGWSIAASLSQDLLDGGVREESINQAQIQHKAAISRYRQSALVAFQEVEYALQADEAIAEQTRLLKEEVRITTLAEKQAQRDYSSGLESARILTVLESQRRAVNARAGLIRIRNQRLQNQVDLFVAMGGNP